MAESATAVENRFAWVDLSSSNPEASRAWYAQLFGWQVQVAEDPQYGGYAIAQLDGRDVAGIGPTQSADQPTAWSVYVGTRDADALCRAVEDAGGRVVAPAFDVGDQGRMAVFQDPSGAFISAWQPGQMGTFHSGASNTFGWAELNARGFEKVVPFYEKAFGWTAKSSPMGEGAPAYTEFQVDGQSIAGGMEMNPAVPEQVPNHWLAYFTVPDVDEAFARATGAGAQAMLPPQDFPGGRFAILGDPQGAGFGLLTLKQ